MNAPPHQENGSELGKFHHSKGQTSRAAILQAAVRLATIKGLNGLSIGDLAAEVGMSKSGLYAHFQSKEDLELATINTAAEIFDREVLQPAIKAPVGSRRLLALVDSYLTHLERRVFPGGCFFASIGTELDTRPGPARDRVVEIQRRWLTAMTQCFLDAQAAGEIDPAADVAQVVFETQAMLLAANFQFVMTNDSTPLIHGRRGAENVLARLVVHSGSKKNRPRREKP
jgi:AcrR family transcriptional regulator